MEKERKKVRKRETRVWLHGFKILELQVVPSSVLAHDGVMYNTCLKK